MTRRRWIADEVNTDRASLIGAHAEHLARVLRARIGQEFDITAGDQVRRGRISHITADQQRVEFELGETVESQAAREVSLLLAIIKFDRMEWAMEKCTELGAFRIVPLIARRTDVHLAKAAEKRVERWRRIAVQAAEQSRSSHVPEISEPQKINARLLDSFSGTRIVLAESEEQTALADVMQNNTGALTLAIGPEGGWAPDEIDLFARQGWTSASLGHRILRAETAAIVALAFATAR